MPPSQPKGSPSTTGEVESIPPNGSSSAGDEATGSPAADDAVAEVSLSEVDVDAALSNETVRELAQQFEDEKPGRHLRGWVLWAVTVAAALVALLVLYQTFEPLAQGSQYYLVIFLGGALPLLFLAYPSGLRLVFWRKESDEERQARTKRANQGPSIVDWVLAAVAVVTCLYPVLPLSGGYNGFLNRQGLLNPTDVVMGALLLILIVEACRRTTGLILPVVCLVFLAYDYYGGYLPQGWAIAHAGLDFSQIVDALYNSPSGFYGTPLDVAASYIVLFTIYGAVLDFSGAGAFFVELSVAAFRRSRSAAGRTAVASGFLLGTVSGSGAATTVSIGAVTWPILRRAGYPAERAGGMLAASGVGAILSPPTLGAAAFIIAEYLDVSYLKVLIWATIPTILYYLGILLSVEIDAQRFGTRPVRLVTMSALRLLGRFGYHFASLFVIVILLMLGQEATTAVVWATLLAGLSSFLDKRHMLTPRRLLEALAAGIRGVLPVVAVCAAAGIITASTTKTGLGPQTASLIVGWAKALASNPTVVICLTAVFAAVALTVLGLAVPVTASFIIGWVIVGQALINLGISQAAAAMFVFYFAVLSEATPPTSLAAVAASAITGGKVIPTMWQTLRYALPAYLVPIAFVLTPAGAGLLGLGGWGQVSFALVASVIGVVSLTIAAGGWLPGVGPAGPVERVIAAIGGLALLWLRPTAVAVGTALFVVSVLLCLARRRAGAAAAVPPVPPLSPSSLDHPVAATSLGEEHS